MSKEFEERIEADNEFGDTVTAGVTVRCGDGFASYAAYWMVSGVLGERLTEGEMARVLQAQQKLLAEARKYARQVMAP